VIGFRLDILSSVFLKILHYALLLFALLVSLCRLGACWGPNVMEGAAILTSTSELVKQTRRGQGSRAVARNTAFAGTQSSLRCCALRYLVFPDRLVFLTSFPKTMKQDG
jgi:hypothetical protein